MRWLILLLSLGSKLHAHFDASQCGNHKTCIYVPAGCEKNNVCKNIFSYAPVADDYVDMEMYSTDYTAGTNYLAVGFSKDDLMGDDAVTQCVFDENGKAEAHVSYNFGKSNQPPQEPEEKTAESSQVELVHAEKDDNSLYCRIRQKISPGPSAFFPNLDQDHTIFLARGKARKPELLGVHKLDPTSPDFPHVSTEKHNIGKRQTVNTQPSASAGPWITMSVRSWLIRFHGILMLFAWLFFIPLAVFAARFFRDHWPGSAPNGLKWWFHLHRTLNLIACLFVIIAVLSIFLAEDWRWTGPAVGRSDDENWNAGGVHSLVGAMAALVAIVNPLMALMRCAPDTGARPIFNWTHRILGIFGFLCAMIAIFIATNWFFARWWSHSLAFLLFLVFLVLLIISTLIFEILDWMKTRTQHKVHQMEMRGRGRYDDNGRIVTYTKVLHERPMHGTTVIWNLFGLAALAIVITLSIFLILSPK
ncbi:unnamed protein product, partial [Mesorhabditis spiculigera]